MSELTPNQTEIKIAVDPKKEIRQSIIKQQFREAIHLIRQLYAKLSAKDLPPDDPTYSNLVDEYEAALQFHRQLQTMLTELEHKYGNDADFLALRDSLDVLIATNRSDCQERVLSLLGPEYKSAWDIMLKEHPALSRVEIKRASKKDDNVLLHTGGLFETPSEFSSMPEPKIIIVPGDTHYEKLFETRQISIRTIAEKMGVAPESLSPKKLAMFIFAHEIGHANDYIENYLSDNPEQAAINWNNKSKAEMSTLPVPDKNPVEVIEMIKSGDIKDPTILEQHEIAYRNLPKEKYADEFATDFITKHGHQLHLD